MAIEKTSIILAFLESLLEREIIISWNFGSNEKISYKFLCNDEEVESKTDFDGLKDIEEEIQEYIEENKIY
ncbi:hypothetical protein AAA294_07330 [Fusobacterium varium]|uniref:hypothetical protein n=1 Tax=Fusobacterium varium TaxID=856 RepID=UPI0032BFA1F8